ncbi:MAG: preprotein translocase subunit YajC [Bacteroidota bacterium]|nr:preprotein translocase subunit YajC [Candidatus Kapabacteria bacterium]MCX7936822.1 preprotein translocase subunit YajC [Chlorobiota bacterium]MDW8270983.1 preprotein translocase subunit YajC [Bacteroidota bacterium]
MLPLIYFLLFAAIVALRAQSPAAPDPTGQLISTLVMFGLIIAVFYFFIVRPQQKRQREMKKMLDELKRGDRVITSAGIHGTVTDIDDKTVVVQIADNVRVRFEKVAIATVEKKNTSEK